MSTERAAPGRPSKIVKPTATTVILSGKQMQFLREHRQKNALPSLGAAVRDLVDKQMKQRSAAA